MLNVNADTLAAHVPRRLGARELVLVGGTAGVLDGAGARSRSSRRRRPRAMMQDGTARRGMIAKLRAATDAHRARRRGGVDRGRPVGRGDSKRVHTDADSAATPDDSLHTRWWRDRGVHTM